MKDHIQKENKMTEKIHLLVDYKDPNPKHNEQNTHLDNTTHRSKQHNIDIHLFEYKGMGRQTRKIKNEIEVFNTIIPTETHLSKEDKEIMIMVKYLQTVFLAGIGKLKNFVIKFSYSKYDDKNFMN